MIHFPCLEGVTPRGEVVMVSDKKYVAEAERKNPGVAIWHENELALYARQMDSEVFDERTFVAVNRLKLKTRGWFVGVEGADSLVAAEQEIRS